MAGLFGFAGVALGAFGAHGLKATLAARGMTAAWDTAVLYHLVHAVALLSIGRPTLAGAGARWPVWAAGAWAVGVVLFSGSLYALALGGPRWLGPVTPLGGTAFLVGWGLVAYGAVRQEGA
ncbi:MAG TPA: DUF423 domain-containing protein [Opitutaceae bacterium]